MDTQTAQPKTYQNPVISLMVIVFVLLLVVGGLVAWSAHEWLSHAQASWDAVAVDAVDARRHRETIGRALALASVIPASIFVILCGVRHETNRVLAVLAPEAQIN